MYTVYICTYVHRKELITYAAVKIHYIASNTMLHVYYLTTLKNNCKIRYILKLEHTYGTCAMSVNG